MKLCLNILLMVVLSFHFATSKRTEETTQEEDGTIKTVITEEWETTAERRGNGRGHGRVRGDTIVIMTNDNENVDHQNRRTHKIAESPRTSIKEKTVLISRFYSALQTDYHFSVDPQEQTILINAGYKNDGSLGRIVIKREDFPECPDLVPIIRLGHDTYIAHAVVATSANLHLWMTTLGWKDTGLIGYGVLEKGKCGATLAVRHLGLGADPVYTNYHTSSDSERNTFLALGYYENIAPIFYLWDNTAYFEPPQRSHAHKTALLTRMYNEKKTDYYYVVSEEEQATLDRLEYQFDANLGRVVTKQTDMSECTDLVPITLLSHAVYTGKALVVHAANVAGWDGWMNAGWKNTGVIGYGVLTKGKCGANVKVRQLMNAQSNFIHTSNDAEYNIYKRTDTVKYIDNAAPIFYIWEA